MSNWPSDIILAPYRANNFESRIIKPNRYYRNTTVLGVGCRTYLPSLRFKWIKYVLWDEKKYTKREVT